MQDQLKPNAALAYAVLDQIDAHPELWDQTLWFAATDCGTVACFAGWACLLSGGEPHSADMQEFGKADVVVAADGDHHKVPVRARQLLGLGGVQAGTLFDPYNNRTYLGRLVTEIFGPRPTGGAGDE